MGMKMPRTRAIQLGPIPTGLEWLERRIAEDRQRILEEPFFAYLDQATTAQDFQWARHLLHHSQEFPRILAYRRDQNENPAMKDFFQEHVQVEAGHAEMLTGWLAEQGLVPSGEPAAIAIPTPATTACIAQAWRTAVTSDNSGTVVSLNAALEAASFDFFNHASPKLDSLGIGHEYWRIHVEADPFHSADGLALLKPVEESSEEGVHFALLARETLQFWGAMLNSWAGVDQWPDLPPA